MRHWVHELLEAVIKEKLPQTMRESLIRLAQHAEGSPDYLFRTSKVEEVHKRIHNSADLEELEKCIFDVATLFDFQYGSIFLIASGDRSAIWMRRVCTTLPERWLQQYKERAYQFMDSAAIKAMSSDAPSLVTRCASDSPIAKAFWDDAEACGVGSACIVFRIQLDSAAVLGVSLTSQGYYKSIAERLVLDMSDLRVLAREFAKRFEELSVADAQNERVLTTDELAFLRLLIANVDVTKAQDLRAFISSSAAMEASIARKFAVDNIFQAVTIAFGRGMLDDLLVGESKVNSLLASLSGLQSFLLRASAGENLSMDKLACPNLVARLQS